MQKKLLFIFLLIGSLSFGQIQGVGINEIVPEQKLHLGSQTGTIRVDGLNGTNNEYNGNVAGQTYPVYVDSNGDLTLEISATENSDGSDAWTISDINSTVTIDGTNAVAGYETVEILDVPLTVTRNVIVEVKYSISMEVFEDPANTIIKDPYARKISNFFTLDQPTLTTTGRRYGQSSRCYFNRNNAATDPSAAPNAATGFIYNSGTTYITLAPGTHTLRFYGTVCSGNFDQDTHIQFAGGPDAIFIRIY
jgi:hypothetical protein